MLKVLVKPLFIVYPFYNNYLISKLRHREEGYKTSTVRPRDGIVTINVNAGENTRNL